MILLDTNVWSELTRPRGDAAVLDWIAARSPEAHLSTIVIAEIRLGIENPEATAKREMLEQWLSDLESAYAERILAFDAPSAHVFGRLAAQRKLARQETKLLDIQLAAQALSQDCLLATRNLRDFEWTGVKLINPWDQ